MTFTAKTPREWREETGTLAKKLSAEFTLVGAEIGPVQSLAEGKIIVGNASSVATDVAMSGDVTIIADGTTSIKNDVELTGAIKLNGTVTLDDDGTIADASNVTTITQNTITLVGATKINLDGATDVTGILTIDTAGSPADGIKINATTPTDGLDIASACGTHAINISAAQTGAGITIGSTCGTYGLNIAGACSTAGIHLSTINKISFHDAGIYMHASADGVFIIDSDGTLEIQATTSITLDSNTTVDGDHTFGTGTGAVSLNGDTTIAAGKTLYIRDASQSIASASDDLMTLTSPTLTLASATKINLDGPVDLTGKLALDAQGGDASVSGLLIGIGTAGTPATDATADGKFVELRCETTATSGDCRLQYMRYYMAGINATGGECLKAGTVLEAAIGTARGGQASIEVSSAGYITGFGCGWEALLEVADSAVPSGGQYCGGQSHIYITGSSSDLTAANAHSIHTFAVSGGDATAEAKVKNAFSFSVANCAGSGAGNMISPGANQGAVTGTIRVLINGDVRYLAYYSAEGHA